MIGQHKRNLALVPYQSAWIEFYRQEADLLLGTLGEKVIFIEHIGSTSIPGMDSKPIIDIMVVVESLTAAKDFISVVEAQGYEYKPLDTVPERLFFTKERSPEIRTHHLNLVQVDSGFWRNQITFRDYLRTHDDVAAEYVDLKNQLAADFARTQQLDRDGKTEFVNRVLEMAGREKRNRNKAASKNVP